MASSLYIRNIEPTSSRTLSTRSADSRETNVGLLISAAVILLLLGLLLYFTRQTEGRRASVAHLQRFLYFIISRLGRARSNISTRIRRSSVFRSYSVQGLPSVVTPWMPRGIEVSQTRAAICPNGTADRVTLTAARTSAKLYQRAAYPAPSTPNPDVMGSRNSMVLPRRGSGPMPSLLQGATGTMNPQQRRTSYVNSNQEASTASSSRQLEEVSTPQAGPIPNVSGSRSQAPSFHHLITLTDTVHSLNNDAPMAVRPPSGEPQASMSNTRSSDIQGKQRRIRAGLSIFIPPRLASPPPPYTPEDTSPFRFSPYEYSPSEYRVDTRVMGDSFITAPSPIALPARRGSRPLPAVHRPSILGERNHSRWFSTSRLLDDHVICHQSTSGFISRPRGHSLSAGQY